MALISENLHMSLPLIPCIFQWPTLRPLFGKLKCKALPATLHWICDAFTPAAQFVFRWIKGLSFSMLTLLLPLCLYVDDIIGSLTHVLLIVPSCQFLITDDVQVSTEQSVWEQALETQLHILHTLSNIENRLETLTEAIVPVSTVMPSPYFTFQHSARICPTILHPKHCFLEFLYPDAPLAPLPSAFLFGLYGLYYGPLLRLRLYPVWLLWFCVLKLENTQNS